MPKPPAKWLADKIEESRRACQPRPCPRCETEIIVGQSDDTMFWTAKVDIADVDLFGEVLARLDGRMSYALVKHGKGQRLEVRDMYAIRRQARPRVVIDHKCARSVPPKSTDSAVIDLWSEL